MNDFVTEFEQFLTNRWFLEGRHYNLRGLFSFYEQLWTGDADKLKTPFGDASKIQEETDYADGQEERTMILKIGDRFVKKVGYYDSWESSNWDGAITEVKPVEQTVVVYEAV
jgi:hypothetical protein